MAGRASRNSSTGCEKIIRNLEWRLKSPSRMGTWSSCIVTGCRALGIEAMPWLIFSGLIAAKSWRTGMWFKRSLKRQRTTIRCSSQQRPAAPATRRPASRARSNVYSAIRLVSRLISELRGCIVGELAYEFDSSFRVRIIDIGIELAVDLAFHGTMGCVQRNVEEDRKSTRAVGKPWCPGTPICFVALRVHITHGVAHQESGYPLTDGEIGCPVIRIGGHHG